MKKLLLATTAVVVLTILAPVAVFAEPTHPNELGLYMTPDGYGATGTYIVGAPVDVFLVLTKPTEVNNGGTPASNIYVFECRLNFNPIGGIFLIGNDTGLNFGDVGHLDDGYLEYLVLFDPGVPVVDDACLLISFTFFKYSLGVINVTLGPTIDPYIPGQMMFDSFDYNANLEVMYSVGGSHDDPVFTFGGEAVPVDQESFGSVKALYR